MAEDFALLMTTAWRQHHLGIFLMLTAVISWSSAGLFTRLLTIDVQSILFWRGIFGTFGLLVIVAVLPSTGGLKAFAKLGWAGVAYAVVTSISMLFFVSALRHTTVAHVAIITAIVPFMAAYLGWAVLREVPSHSALVASSVALAGVAIMVGVNQDGHWSGDAVAVAMALGMAVMILISRKHTTIPALQATALASLFSAVFVLPVLSFKVPTASELTILVAFSLVNQVIGFGLFAMGASRLPPTQAALITALEAPLAPLWVWVFLSEVPGLATLVGGALVVAAVVGDVLLGRRTEL
jgi:drug/metabolite transporter (DMT)-like permease